MVGSRWNETLNQVEKWVPPRTPAATHPESVQAVMSFKPLTYTVLHPEKQSEIECERRSVTQMSTSPNTPSKQAPLSAGGSLPPSDSSQQDAVRSAASCSTSSSHHVQPVGSLSTSPQRKREAPHDTAVSPPRARLTDNVYFYWSATRHFTFLQTTDRFMWAGGGDGSGLAAKSCEGTKLHLTICMGETPEQWRSQDVWGSP